MIKQNISKKNIHYPTLNTVMMVEDVLKKMNESVISVAELKRRLPKQVNHITLMIILEYLEKSGKIIAGLRGVSWVYTESNRIKELIKRGTEI